ncbi:hypothetical protein HBH70_179610 [Parastagonospora nodorum]|nr:hypothetical protein HBH53_195280 [Parastagonospora nodorum]KAH3966049.1 hypothetical protein HBH52_200530 [Parastagonospora nodorum]KAH3973501.1 hypothetical protein HBH51_099120 [Parastagonospora nodorum]KAH4002264.1 hypothetical protein HBI10_075440 [Parastagonospora nodorum]KAH4025900.1 hypothetical protein HBI13_071250 [Parastagonospora nodorum]
MGSYETGHQDTMNESFSPSFLFEDAAADQFFHGLGEGENYLQHGQPYVAVEDGMSPEGFLARMDIEESPSWLSSSLNGIQLDANDNLNPQVLGHSGDMDPYLLQHYRYDSTCATFKFKQLTIHSVCQDKVPTQFLVSRPEIFTVARNEMGLRQVSTEVAREELEALVPADTGLRLIALFRRFILSQYPIFSESHFPGPQSSPPHLLAAVYMVAQPFAKFDDVLSVELAYETLNNRALFRLVTEALQFETHNPSLSTVQTLLLLVSRPSTNPLVLESSFKWSLHGQLVSTAQNLGLQYDPGSWNIAPWQISLRRRISCTIYTSDKWLASSLGRPPLVTRDTWLVTSVTSMDSNESGLSSEIWLHHILYAKLGSLLGDVLAQLYSLRAVQETTSNVQHTLNISKVLLQELSNWHQDCPQPAESSDQDAVSLPTICILGYHYVQMTIFRAIVRPFVANSGPVETGDVVTHSLTNHQDVNGFARTGVRSSTTAASKYVKSLREEHFHMFWPHWSQVAFSCICFLNLLMAITSPDMQEATTWFRDLHMTRKEMRLKSNMLPVLRLGLLRIDALFWKGIDKVLRLQPHVQDALAASMDTSTSNTAM